MLFAVIIFLVLAGGAFTYLLVAGPRRLKASKPDGCPRCGHAGPRANFCPACGWQYVSDNSLSVWLIDRRDMMERQRRMTEESEGR